MLTEYIPSVNSSKAIHGRVVHMGIDPPRPISIHVAIIPHLAARTRLVHWPFSRFAIFMPLMVRKMSF
jgi:hypothetical protein